ncbi:MULTISPECIES: ABC transporter ATP-binding protein [Corynebacterium]|nr:MULTISPECIES: ABC transporter ATP-binding protein [Corynebacterium]OFK64124.1 hypothetical protein HMPREF2807_01575 [Corynebacterium sp. HMSC074A09]OFN33207.1 hypothetical protein HMPREF2565_01915 [Corynebacterium sp. HMSC072A04]OFP32045.1 hypothetical protein HMPREF2993_06130 [Corynebacterium sp. HMSC068G04]OHO57728.1 hypothetical protein HMPREF2635_02985 [Corynebacterium sp. HMSC035E02]
MIMEIARRFRRWGVTSQIIWCLAFSSAFAGFSIVQPALLAKLIDGSNNVGESLEEQALALLLVVVLATTFNALLIRQEGRLIAKIRGSLQKDLISTVDANQFELNHGRGLQVVVGDTDTVAHYIVGLLSKILPGAGMFIFAFIALLRIDTILTLLVLAMGVSLSALSVPFLKRMARAEQANLRSRDELSDTLLTYFSVAKVATLNGRLEHLKKIVTNSFDNLQQATYRSATIQAQFAPFNGSIVPILAVTTLGVASWRVRVGAMDPSELIEFLMYMFILMAPLLRALSLASQRAKAHTAWREISTLNDIENPRKALPERVLKVLDRNQQKLLDSTGITIILGPSGIGKTTLLHDVAATVGPTDTAFVSQEPKLLPHTLEDTLQLYGSGPDSERFMNNLSCLRMPDCTLTTTIARMSGGERQRVAIAAALSSNKETLILDEPTSSLGTDDQRDLAKLLRNHVNNGARVILSTHNSDFVEFMLPANVLELEENV